MGPRRSRLQRLLIAGETMMALVLLVGAALLTHSLWRLFSEDAGIDETNLWVAEVQLPPSYPAVPLDFWSELVASIRELPEVEVAGATTSRPPLSGSNNTRFGIYPEGETGDEFGGLTMVWRSVTPGYFEALGFPIRGRAITDSDTAGSERVAVLNEAAADALWPQEDALGRRMGESPTWTVVGIIPDSRVRLDRAPPPQMYTAAAQETGPGAGRFFGSIVVRTRPATPRGLADGLRTTIASHAQDAVSTISTMSGVRWRAVQNERYRTGILLAFAGIATLLATIGIFGVVAYNVVQRRREIGLRIALGARAMDVRRVVLSVAVLPVAVGVVAGLAVSLVLTRLLESFLYEITPSDTTTLATAVGPFSRRGLSGRTHSCSPGIAY